jgi:hypothetical protein
MRYEWHLGPANVYSKQGLTDVVSSVDWYCTAYAPDGTTYKASGIVDVGPPNPSSFVPFSGISQSTVQSWVFAKINQTNVETALATQYASASNPSIKQFNF